MDLKNEKMVPRGEKEVKFNIRNKTDRKILFTILICLFIAIIILIGLILLYFLVLK